MTADSRTKREFEEIIGEKKKEIEYLEGLLKEKDNIPKEVLDLKEEIEKVLSENKLPYLFIKERQGNKFSILKTQGLKVTVSKNYQGDTWISLVSTNGGADSSYSYLDTKCRLYVCDKEYTFSRDFKLCKDLLSDIKNGFKESEEIRKFLIKALNDEIKNDYSERKARLNTVFETHYHSFISVTDTDGKHEL